MTPEQIREQLWGLLVAVVGEYDRDRMELGLIEYGLDLDAVCEAIAAGDFEEVQARLAPVQAAILAERNREA